MQREQQIQDKIKLLKQEVEGDIMYVLSLNKELKNE